MRLAALAAVVTPLLALAGQPFALESRGGPGVLSGAERWRVQYVGDNDSIGMVTEPSTGNGYDRWYTTGTQLLVRHDLDTASLHWLPERSRLLLNGSLLQNIYTPRSATIATSGELAGDRPYAGLLTLSLGAELVLDRAPLSFTTSGYTHLGLDLEGGTTGAWSLAGQTQHTAHEAWRVFAGQQMPPLIGWGVAETRAELAADATAFAETTLATRRLTAPSWMTWSGAQPVLHWLAGARLGAGTIRGDGAVTTTLALGWMGDPIAPAPARFPLAGYLYLRSELRGVWWNRTIDGQLRDGSVPARSAPLVAEVSAGAVVRVYGLEVSWVHAYRTNEVASLPGPLQTGQLLWHWSAAWAW